MVPYKLSFYYYFIIQLWDLVWRSKLLQCSSGVCEQLWLWNQFWHSWRPDETPGANKQRFSLLACP